MLPSKNSLNKIYDDADSALVRFGKLAEKYQEIFKSSQMEFFTSPGRTEIIGNHTDHNGGKVIAGSISLDTIGAAFPSGNDVIHIQSEGYDEIIHFRISELDAVPKCQASLSLVAGMIKAAKDSGFNVDGFNLYTSSDVIPSAGVSSSAAFEMLLCSVINYFFNQNRMEIIDYARIGQKAENEYWCKASGLMDQISCAAGGVVKLDFGEKVKYEKIDFDFERLGYNIIIVNTGKGHADLSAEYSSIPAEMKSVAEELGCNQLYQSSLEELEKRSPELIDKLKNDRAILRAFHFFNETKRVEEMEDLIKAGRIEEILRLIDESGKSSFMLLQNCYVNNQPCEQKISLCLALTSLFIKKIGDGVCRVHGGGFAGVIMVILPEKAVADYRQYMGAFVGKENVYVMNIRQIGAVHIQK